MADIPELPYNEDAGMIDNAIEYSNLEISEPSEAFIANLGEITLNPAFDEFDTHVYMCYEYTNCQLLEPITDTTGDLYGILICRTAEEV